MTRAEAAARVFVRVSGGEAWRENASHARGMLRVS